MFLDGEIVIVVFEYSKSLEIPSASYRKEIQQHLANRQI